MVDFNREKKALISMFFSYIFMVWKMTASLTLRFRPICGLFGSYSYYVFYFVCLFVGLILRVTDFFIYNIQHLRFKSFTFWNVNELKTNQKGIGLWTWLFLCRILNTIYRIKPPKFSGSGIGKWKKNQFPPNIIKILKDKSFFSVKNGTLDLKIICFL